MEPRTLENARAATPELRRQTPVRFGAWVWSIAALWSIAVIAHRVIADDQWWHISTGRWILAHHAIPDGDPFSYTYFGQRWINWEWLFGVIIAPLWDGLGVPGLYLLRAVTTGACVVATAAHMLRKTDQVARSFGLLLLGMLLLCMQYRIGDRPHAVGFAMLAGTFLWAETWIERPTWGRAGVLIRCSCFGRTRTHRSSWACCFWVA